MSEVEPLTAAERRSLAPWWIPGTPAIISIMLVSAVIGLPPALRWMGPDYQSDPNLKDTIDTIKTLATIAVSFWLGSSASSRGKDDTQAAQAKTIARLTPNLQGPGGVLSADTTVTTSTPPTVTTTTGPAKIDPSLIPPVVKTPLPDPRVSVGSENSAAPPAL